MMSIFNSLLCIIIPLKILASPAYKCTIENMIPCEGPQFENMESPMEDLIFSRISRKSKALSFKVTFKQPVGDNIGTKLVIEKHGNNGRVELPFIPLIKNACKVYSKHFHKIWVEILTKMNVTNPNDCPIPPGHYRLDKYVFNEQVIEQRVPIKGRFNAKTIMVDLNNNNRVITCIDTLMIMEEDV